MRLQLIFTIAALGFIACAPAEHTHDGDVDVFQTDPDAGRTPLDDPGFDAARAQIEIEEDDLTVKIRDEINDRIVRDARDLEEEGDTDTGGAGEAPAGFVLIPAGSFDMGCTAAQEATGYCEIWEYPVHTVTLTHDFYMGATEVTQGEFERLMRYNPSYFDSCGSDCPVEGLSWYESAAYANALSSTEGLDSCYWCSGSGSSVSCSPVSESDPYSCEGYRLPTEAEWEYAARAGTDLVYAGSDDVDEVAWTNETSVGRIWAAQPVGSLSPNGWGLYDMSGNVFDWTGDRFDYSAYDRGDSVDPVGISIEDSRVSGEDSRVIRGGCWFGDPRYARVAFRNGHTPYINLSYVGLRLARTLP